MSNGCLDKAITEDLCGLYFFGSSFPMKPKNNYIKDAVYMPPINKAWNSMHQKEERQYMKSAFHSVEQANKKTFKVQNAK